MLEKEDSLRERVQEVRDALWILQRQSNDTAELYWGTNKAHYDEHFTEACALGTAISLIDEALNPSDDYV